MAYLVLENGTAFEGKRIGAKKNAAGELVFTTGVVGYVETLTDPANAGLIVMQTFPLIGNYGVTEQDEESSCIPAGYVVRNLCDTPSNFRSQTDVNTFLQKKGIPGICGVDTRRLAAILRQEGSMKAWIVDEKEDMPSFETEKAEIIPCEKAFYPAVGAKKARAILWDFGAKKSLIEKMTAFGWTVERVPFDTKAQDIPSGDLLVLAGGAEEAETDGAVLEEVKAVLGGMPVLAVGLGHELAARALGGRVNKMLCGHRGQNQPVYSTLDGRTYITCQNHGYCVDAESLQGKGEMICKNLNDGSCEGMEYRALRCLSVQFDPEEWVLRYFAARMGGDQDA